MKIALKYQFLIPILAVKHQFLVPISAIKFNASESLAAPLTFSKICQKSFLLADIVQLYKY